MSEVEEDTRPKVDLDDMAYGKEIRHLELEDIAEVKEGGDERLVQVMRDYLHDFIAPIRKDQELNGETVKQEYCPACGEPFTGLMANMGFGVGIEWGLVHGEGHCSKCHWPYRGHHRVYDPEELKAAPEDERPEPMVTMHNLFLAYHPDYVRGWKPPAKRD